jgi:hypothetical protein
MEKFGIYHYRIVFKADANKWGYEILKETGHILRESKDLFQYEGIARFAAIGHISLLEQGKG